ncbi:MAG: fumarylacetoacetate hydrolase family protein [Actinomycetota bacterium]
MGLLQEMGDRLYEAMQARQPIPPLTEELPEMSVDEAYTVQTQLVERLIGDGASVTGYKLGLTSRPMQQMIGVDQPDFAPVMSHMVHDESAPIDLSRFIQPKVEAEIALVLKEPLRGPGVTTLQAGRAVAGAVAAIELVDSRIQDWKVRLADTVADLASAGAIVLGQTLVPLQGWDLRLTGMAVERNGELEDTGAGAAALGSPLAAVAWLANTLAPYDVELQPGHVVMTGALHRAFEVAPGDLVRAEFDRIGAVTVRFA